MGVWNRFFGRSHPKSPKTKEGKLIAALDKNKIPLHIAIIMDGNGRWAKRKGLLRAAGHRAGVESLRDVVSICSSLGVKYLTVYAFSTENWKRPQEEVDILMNLLVEYLQKEIDELDEKNVKVNAIGRITELNAKAREALADAIERTKGNNGLTLNLALNYGGRTEITDAVKSIVKDISNARLTTESIDEEVIQKNLYTAGMPDPDLVIRPSGELRISNFLLWQIAYSEFWYCPVLWPDFRKEHLIEAIQDYQNRQRRYGGL